MAPSYMSEVSWYKHYYQRAEEHIAALWREKNELAAELAECRQRAERAESELQTEKGRIEIILIANSFAVARAKYWQTRHCGASGCNRQADRNEEMAEILGNNGSD